MSKSSAGMMIMLLFICNSALAQFQPETGQSVEPPHAAADGQQAAADSPAAPGIPAEPAGAATASKAKSAAGQKTQVAQNAAPAPESGAASAEYVGEMYKIGLGWHPAALRDVPRDKYGLADWVQMLRKGIIRPQPFIDPAEKEDPPLDLEIVMPSNTDLLAGAHFPHSIHTEWLNCESCHIKIFMPQVGANNLTMSRIVKGEACGVCHGKVAFPLNHCERCHVPQPGGSNQTAAAP